MGNAQSVNKKDLERYAVFVFGIVFLSAILALLVLIPKPSLAQFFAFRLTLALAAAGVGALIPGFIQFEQRLSHKGLLRCGGAMALFAAVWFSNPAKYAIEELAPPSTEDARTIIESFLAVSDQNDHSLAYSKFSNRERAAVSRDSYVQLVGNVRTPLGTRSAGPYLWQTQSPNEIPGRKGPFVFNTYQSTFNGKPGVWIEVAGVVAEEGKWRMHTYIMQPCTAPMCQPLDRFK